AAGGDVALVGGALVNADGLGVRRELRVLGVAEVRPVRVVRIGGIVIEPAPDPSRAGVGEVIPHEAVLVVTGVEDPCEGELFLVAEALHAVGLGLCLGKRGQEHAREDGDDRDHHQQLDEGEATGARRAGGGGTNHTHVDGEDYCRIRTSLAGPSVDSVTGRAPGTSVHAASRGAEDCWRVPSPVHETRIDEASRATVSRGRSGSVGISGRVLTSSSSMAIEASETTRRRAVAAIGSPPRATRNSWRTCCWNPAEPPPRYSIRAIVAQPEAGSPVQTVVASGSGDWVYSRK